MSGAERSRSSGAEQCPHTSMCNRPVVIELARFAGPVKTVRCITNGRPCNEGHQILYAICLSILRRRMPPISMRGANIISAHGSIPKFSKAPRATAVINLIGIDGGINLCESRWCGPTVQREYTKFSNTDGELQIVSNAPRVRKVIGARTRISFVVCVIDVSAVRQRVQESLCIEQAHLTLKRLVR
jgi:hypothetical protein